MRFYKMTPNYSKKTYTIRVYENGKLLSKYRTIRASEMYDDWTQDDIKMILRTEFVIKLR